AGPPPRHIARAALLAHLQPLPRLPPRARVLCRLRRDLRPFLHPSSDGSVSGAPAARSVLGSPWRGLSRDSPWLAVEPQLGGGRCNLHATRFSLRWHIPTARSTE